MRGLFKWMRYAAIAVGALSAAAVAAIGTAGFALLFTEQGSVFALRELSSHYNDLIPGKIEIGRISGALGMGMHVSDVVLKDRHGRPLLEIESLGLMTDITALLTPRIHLPQLQIENATLYLRDDAAPSGFGDLAPTGKENPTDDETPFKLPLEMAGTIRVSGFSLVSIDRDGVQTTPVTVSELTARFDGRGRSAQLTVHGVRGVVDALDPSEAILSFRAAWTGETVTASDVRLSHAEGTLVAPVISVDLTTLKGDVELAAVMRAESLKARLGFPFVENPSLYLNATGPLESMTGMVRLTTGPEGALTTRFEGDLYPTPDLSAAFEVTGPPPIAGVPGEPRVTGSGMLRISGADYRSARMDLKFDCRKCRITPLGLVDSSLNAHLEGGNGAITGTAGMRGATLDSEATLDNWRLASMAIQGEIPSAAALLSLFDIPELDGVDGAVTLSAQCATEQDLFTCTTNAEGRRLRTPYGSSPRLTGTVTLSPFADDLPYQGTVRLRNLYVNGNRLGRVRAAVNGDKSRVNAKINAHLTGSHRLSATFGIDFGPTLHLGISTLRASYKHLALALSHPARIAVSGGRIQVDELGLRVAGGQVRLNGVFDKDGTSDVKAVVHRLKLDAIAAMIPGHDVQGIVDGRLSLVGTARAFRSDMVITAERVRVDQADIGNIKLNTVYRPGKVSGWVRSRGGPGKRIEAGFAFHADADLSKGTFALSPGEIYADGRAEHLDLHALSGLVPGLDLAGSTDFTIAMRGTLHAPRIKVDGGVSSFKWREVSVGDAAFAAWFERDVARVEMDLAGPAARQLRFAASVPVQWTGKSAVWHPESPHRVVVSIDGGELDMVSRIRAALGRDAIPEIPVSGTIDVMAELSGQMADPAADVYVETDNLEWQSHPIGRVSTRFSIHDQVLNLHAQLRRGASRYADLKMQIPFAVKGLTFEIDPRPNAHHRVDFQFSGLKSELFTLLFSLPKPLGFQVSGNISGAGRLGDFYLKGAVQGDVRYAEYGPFYIRGAVNADPVRQVASLSVGPENAPFLDARLETALPAQQAHAPKAILASLPIDGRVTIPHLDLNRFSIYLPTTLHRLDGVLDGVVTVGGTAAQPEISGRLKLEKGAVTVAPLNQRIWGILMDIAISGKRAELRRLAFKSGGGNGSGKFTLSFGDGALQGEGKVRFKRFPFVRPGLPQGLINGEIAAMLVHGSDATDISLAIRNTDVHLLKTSGGASPKDIREGESIVYLDHTDGKRKTRDPAAASRRIVLTADLTDPVEIRGQGVEMRWDGEVRVVQQGGKNQVSGGIEAKPGRFRLLGNIFELETGAVTFPPSGGLDPFVNIVATATTSEARVTATVKGRATKPDLILTSEPTMSQYQIVTLLITGRSDTSGERETEVDVPTQVASLLLSFNNPVLERQLYQKLGVDRIAVSVGSSMAEPILVVGKRVSRRVYIESEYHHNAPSDENRASGRIEYRLAPGWTLETEYGDAQKGEVGVFWQKRFGEQDGRAEE